MNMSSSNTSMFLVCGIRILGSGNLDVFLFNIGTSYSSLTSISAFSFPGKVTLIISSSSVIGAVITNNTYYKNVSKKKNIVINVYVPFKNTYFVVVITNQSFPHAWSITGFVTRVTDMAGSTSEAALAYPCGAPEFTLVF